MLVSGTAPRMHCSRTLWRVMFVPLNHLSKLLVTSATLVVTGALLVVTRSY